MTVAAVILAAGYGTRMKSTAAQISPSTWLACHLIEWSSASGKRVF